MLSNFKVFNLLLTAMFAVSVTSILAENFVYATVSNNNPPTPGVKTLATVPAPAGANSGGLAINTQPNRIHVASFCSYTLPVMDGKDDNIIDTIQVGEPSFIAPGENQPPFLPLNGPVMKITDRTKSAYS